PSPHPPLHSFPTRRSSDLSPGRTKRSRTSAARGRLRRSSRTAEESTTAKSPIPFRALLTDDLGRREAGLHRRKRRQTLDQFLHRSEEHTSELQSPCNLVCR